MLRALFKSVLSRSSKTDRSGAFHAAALVEQALSEQSSGDLECAERCFRRALHHAPDHTDALQLLAALLIRSQRAAEAIAYLEHSLELDPSNATARYQLAAALQAADRRQESIVRYDEIGEQEPMFALARLNLGNIWRESGRAVEARDAYLAAVGANPGLCEAWHNLGNVESDFGRYAEAIACFDRALAIAPDLLEAKLSRALAQLAVGAFSEGWSAYEVRLHIPRLTHNARAIPLPTWRRERLDGTALMVWGEQGIAEEILFAGMYPQLLAEVSQVVLECSPKLVALFRRSFPRARIVPRSDPPAIHGFADASHQIAAGSLARWLRPDIAHFPAHDGYLVADPERTEYWRRRLGELGPGLKVGFSWRSTSSKTGARGLSFTRLEQWDQLLRVAGVHWICLQYGECERELEQARARSDVALHRFSGVDYFDDLDEVAALIGALDLVITVRTAVCYQAAALGVETWQVLYGMDWQTHGTSCNPWLPAIVRYPRSPGRSWEQIFSLVASHLRARTHRSEEWSEHLSCAGYGPDTSVQLAARAELSPQDAAGSQGVPGDVEASSAAAIGARALLAAGQVEEGLLALESAVARAPLEADTWQLLGQAAAKAGRSERALTAFRTAARLQPGSTQAWIGIAQCERQLGDVAAAVDAYRHACALRSDVPELHYNLGVLLEESSDARGAEACYRAAVALQPALAPAQLGLGILLYRANDALAAEPYLRNALEIDPHSVAAQLHLGLVLQHLGRLGEAETMYRAVLRSEPSSFEACFNLGGSLFDDGEAAQAIPYFEQALRMSAESASEAELLAKLGCDRGLAAIAPTEAQAGWHLGLGRLWQGDFQRGWLLYECRSHVAIGVTRPYEARYPVWNGEPLLGRTLLVRGEQGVADEVLFASMYEELLARGARLVVECRRKLSELFERSFPEALVVPSETSQPLLSRIRPDYQISAGSLARWLRPALETFPNRRSYLRADPGRVRFWRERLNTLGSGLKIGFSWRSGDLSGARALSFTALSQWDELLRMPDVVWVSLQYDDCEVELEAAKERTRARLHRFSDVDYYDDLDELAALMSSLDLVITVRTAVCFQSAALGVETWQLIYGSDWQTHGTAGNPWLPALTRFARLRGESWESVLGRVATHLRQRVAAPERFEGESEHAPRVDALERARALRKQGRLQDAVVAYRASMEEQPLALEAHIELARLLDQLDLRQDAERAYRAAIRLLPALPELHINLGNLLQRWDRANEARECAVAADKLPSQRAETTCALGSLWERLSCAEEACRCYRSAVAIDRAYGKGYVRLGALLLQQRDFLAAQEALAMALGVGEDSWEVHLNLGQALLELRRFDAALQSLENAGKRAPRRAECFRALGELNRRRGDHSAAAAYYERAVALDPDDADTRYRLGIAYFLLERLDDALLQHRAAIERSSTHHAARIALNRTLQESKRTEEAIEGYREMLHHRSDDAWAHWNLAHALLSKGELRQGFEQYEWRFHPDVGVARARKLPHPTWKGEPIAGKRIVVCREQGIGDQILFATLYPGLMKQGAQCVIECAPKLSRLFARSFAGAEVVAKTDPPHPSVLASADFQVSAGSLARYLRPMPEDWVPVDRVLHADPQRVLHWRQRLDRLGPEPKVGFSWRSHDLSGERFLACTALEDWKELLGVEGVRFVCLQYDDCETELAAVRDRAIVRFSEIDMFDDLDETAAMMCALDLVISAPTTVSVLSAALGVPTWQLSHGTDWQMLGRRDHPWLAAIMRHTRAWGQPRTELLAQIARLLLEWATARGVK